jgi:hypothetical protein
VSVPRFKINRTAVSKSQVRESLLLTPEWTTTDRLGSLSEPAALEFNDQYKLPDDDQGAENTPKIYIESGGLMTVADTESIGERLYADGGLYVDACGTFVTGNIGDGDRRDPRSGEWQIFPWGDADGYDITVEGNVATVHGTPEPATIMLLGLGGLALIRRRK